MTDRLRAGIIGTGFIGTGMPTQFERAGQRRTGGGVDDVGNRSRRAARGGGGGGPLHRVGRVSMSSSITRSPVGCKLAAQKWPWMTAMLLSD